MFTKCCVIDKVQMIAEKSLNPFTPMALVPANSSNRTAEPVPHGPAARAPPPSQGDGDEGTTPRMPLETQPISQGCSTMFTPLRTP